MTPMMTSYEPTFLTIGKQPMVSDALSARACLVSLQENGMKINLEKTCWVMPPSNEHQTGFQTIIDPVYGGIVKAEGVISRDPDSTIVIPTGDCPALSVYDRSNGHLLFTHAGRNALDGGKGDGQGILRTALEQFMPGRQPHNIKVYIAAHIHGSQFDHSHQGAEQHVAWFLKRYGKKVFQNLEHGKLDLLKVCFAELQTFGITKRQVSYDERCTKASDELSSYRNGDLTRNINIATTGSW
jgi:copper oxidase (laccase) domain-containing protein